MIARPTGRGEGAGHIGGCEVRVQCDGTHEYTLPIHRGGGCPMPLTAATSLHVVTHSVISVHNDYTAACVCRVQRENDSQQTNKQQGHTHL